MKKKTKRRIKTAILFVVLSGIVILVDLPLISMIGTAFKRNDAVLTTTGIFPEWGDWSVENFVGVFTKTKFGRNIVNSLFISAFATVLSVLMASMAGYALSRFRGKFFSSYSALLVLMQMFPAMLLLIPMFVLFSKYKMVNQPVSVMIYYAASNLAFSIMMIRSFFDSIPYELEESGKIDGGTNFGVYLRVIMPISLPGVATIGIMTFLNCWNEFTFASLLLRDTKVQTLTVGLTKFVQQSTSQWGYLMAASTIAVIPALLFLVFAQKYLVSGMTSGAVKG